MVAVGKPHDLPETVEVAVLRLGAFISAELGDDVAWSVTGVGSRPDTVLIATDKSSSYLKFLDGVWYELVKVGGE